MIEPFEHDQEWEKRDEKERTDRRADSAAEGRVEAAAPKAAKDPGEPTPQERREHNLNHLPFRSWCRHCVEGRAKADRHCSHPDEEEDDGKHRWVCDCWGIL